MYFSAQTGGFYNDEIHGARRILIQDPAWVRPLIEVVLQPGESAWVGEEWLTNEGDEPLTFRDVPDRDAIPETLEVVNPACLIPDDAVEISVAFHAELLAGQSTGQVITWGEDGIPLLADPPPLSAEAVAAAERVWRDGRLAETDGVVARHRDEVEAGQVTTLTPTQYAELQAYRSALRKWPESGEFPLTKHRPSAPQWLAAQTQ